METYVPLVYRQLVDDELFRRLSQTRDFLAANYHQVITLEDAAREGCLSPFHFQRMFKRAFGETPHEFLTRQRIEHAQNLLRNGHSVTEVCYEVGYESLGSFSTKFARQVGVPPSEFRRVFSVPSSWWMRRIPACFAFQNGVLIRPQ